MAKIKENEAKTIKNDSIIENLFMFPTFSVTIIIF